MSSTCTTIFKFAHPRDCRWPSFTLETGTPSTLLSGAFFWARRIAALSSAGFPMLVQENEGTKSRASCHPPSQFRLKSFSSCFAQPFARISHKGSEISPQYARMTSFRLIPWRRRPAGVFSLRGLIKKPPARRRSHKDAVPSKKIRSIRSANSDRREKCGLASSRFFSMLTLRRETIPGGVRREMRRAQVQVNSDRKAGPAFRGEFPSPAE